MQAAERREKVLEQLGKENHPISASTLANQFGVSRQVIVGDIALMRAAGIDILSTPKGYMKQLNLSGNHYIGKVVCQHTLDQTKEEIYTILENGGELMDVIIDHPFYGELTGRLNISNKAEADVFLKKTSETKAGLLSELTKGIHLHTIACEDQLSFERIKSALKQRNILYQE